MARRVPRAAAKIKGPHRKDHRVMFTKSRAFAVVGVVLAACLAQDDRQMTIRPRTSSDTQAIQGGTLDSGDPNVVAIVINAGGGIAICSGSLIAPNLVLSAHHCVADVGNTSSCGSNSFGTQYANSAFRITTSGTAAYNSFNTGSIPTVDNSTWFGVRQVWTPGNDICGQDMSLLELTTNVSGVTPIIPRVDTVVGNNETYTAVGFGITSPSGQAAGKRYTVSGLNVLCPGNCGGGMSPGDGEWEGGSTTQAKGTCEGDSGGPAIDAQGRVIGTVSRGPANSCSDTVYEAVYAQSSWIKSTAQTAATDGQYTAPSWATGGMTGTGGGAGGGSGAGGGVGSTGGGSGSTGGGSSSGSGCSDPSLQCVDASGMGNYACITSAGGFPAGAQSCQQDSDCPNNYACWSGGSTSACLQNCGSSSTGTGGGAGGGSGSTGGGSQSGTGGGSSSGTGGGTSSGSGCSDPSLQCVDASGMGNYACITSAGGFPSNAQTCMQDSDCPSNYACWSSGSSSACLQNCGASSTGTGGGAGGGSQSGTGGGSQSGTGGGSQSGTGGGSQSGSGGGSIHMGTGGGSQSGTGGSSGTGGNSSGTGGNSSGTGGNNGNGGNGGGTGSVTQTGMGSGCSASGASMPAFGLIALLALLRPRRRVTA
jgi:hypothetical protein